ncbi:MAG: RadC family protein [Clostridia bacterium]|nr:RadC family protein [Clostridia bacterium]
MKETKDTAKKTAGGIHSNHRERMREVYLKNGFDAFSEVEILEYMLFFAIPRVDTNPIAHRLLDRFGNLDNVLEAPVEALMQVDGVGYHTALYLNLMLNVTNTYTKSKRSTIISGTNAAKEYCAKLFTGKTVEEFYVICLSSKNHIISCDKIGAGSVSKVNIIIKDITKLMVLRNCDRIIISHNHPKGFAQPSDEDLNFTRSILTNCFINDVDVLDHIIVGSNGQFALSETSFWKTLRNDAIERLINKNNYSQFLQPSASYNIDQQIILTKDDLKLVKYE